MSTSGVYTLAVNRDQIIRTALLILSKLEETETPSAQEVTDCALFLNMLVTQWQGKADFAPGLKTWTRKRGHLFLSNTTGQYTLGPAGTGWTNSYNQTTTSASAVSGAAAIVVTVPDGAAATNQIGIQLTNGNIQWTTISSVVGSTINLGAPLAANVNGGALVFYYATTAQQPVIIETAILRDINNQDIPLNILTVQDYDYLPSKTDITVKSDPVAIYYEFLLGNSLLFTDVAAAQDTSKHIVLTYMEAVQVFTTALDNPYYPVEWYLALAYGLAKLLAPIFTVAWTPIMQDNYANALAVAQNKEAEINNIYFQLHGDE